MAGLLGSILGAIAGVVVAIKVVDPKSKKSSPRRR